MVDLSISYVTNYQRVPSGLIKTWLAGKWTMETSDVPITVKPSFSSGIFQIAMWLLPKGTHHQWIFNWTIIDGG